MQAVLLASGLNTRVSHIHKDIPKAMFPLGNVPYISHTLNMLLSAGITEIIIIVHYKKEAIIDFVQTLPSEKKKAITIVERKENYGPVGALVEIEHLLKETFFLIYADILFSFKAKDVITALNGFEVATLITKDPFNMFNSMEIEIDETKKIVTDFSPNTYTHENGWMDVGQLNRKSIVHELKKCPPEEEHINKNMWPSLIKNKKLTYYKVGAVFDIGTENNYRKTEMLFKERGLSALD